MRLFFATYNEGYFSMAMTGSEIVSAAIEDVNALLEDGQKIEDRTDFPLLGGGTVDSLTFINLVSAIEDKIEADRGETVVMIDESLLDDTEQMFSTIGALKSFVTEKLS